MLLGSDIDGVVIDFVSVIQRQFQELYNIVLPYDKISTYRIEDCVPLSSEQVESVIDDILLKSTLPIYLDALYYLTEYMKDNKVVFITSRKQKYTNETWLCLAKYFGRNFQVFFEGVFDKAYFVKSLKVDFFVEDRVKHIIRVASTNPNCAVLIMDRPWNKDWDETVFNNVTRVKGWKEIIKTIETFG